MLPYIPYPKQTRKQAQTSFGGLDRRAAAGNGAICDMTNLWSGDAPLISSRPARMALSSLTTPHGIFAAGSRLWYVDGTSLYCNGVLIGTVSDTDKVFTALGDRVLIWPDKVMAREVDDPSSESGTSGTASPTAEESFEVVPLEATVTVSATIEAGTYAGQPATANTIKAADATTDFAEDFRVGDGLHLVSLDGTVDMTIIVREIEGDELRFYDNSFTGIEWAGGSITISREVPDLDFLCVHDNRVWGCRHDTIRCSKLGDPFNWNVFDGISTDAWSWDTGTAGWFTACITYMGYPCFFKEESVFKIYGSRPSNFEAMSAPQLGVLAGAHRSLAVARETLYYLSRAGFVAYTGGVPSVIGEELARKYTGAVGGSDGLRYWVSATYADPSSAAAAVPSPQGEGSGVELLCYDPAVRTWHREDGTDAHSFAFLAGLYCLTNDGERLLWSSHSLPAGAAEEGVFSSSVTFADWDYQSFDSKYPVRLWVRAEAQTGTSLTVRIRYDGGAWETVQTYAPGVKGTRYLPVPVRRCGHYALRIDADGPWKLWAIEHELLTGTESRRA